MCGLGRATVGAVEDARGGVKNSRGGAEPVYDTYPRLGGCMNDHLVINALVTAAKQDLSRGIKREDLLQSLANVVSGDIYRKIKDRI